MRLTSLALIVAGAVAAAWPVPAVADDDVIDVAVPVVEAPGLGDGTFFDLGVEFKPVLGSPDAARRSFAELPDETRRILTATCNHYVGQTLAVTSRDTLEFCAIALGG